MKFRLKDWKMVSSPNNMCKQGIIILKKFWIQQQIC